jgi:deazaflavin-dependent oxidoreductase (nitroreductase family)
MNTDNGKTSIKSNIGNGSKWLMKFLTWLNVVLYRISGGRLLNKMEGCPVCLVTMTGHKSGKKKTIALMYTADGDNVLLVASLGGAPKNPVWYFNLKAQPEIEIQLGRVRRKMLAREAGADERARLWPKVVASYPSFANYQQKTTRAIPVFVCAPAK